MSSPIDRLPRPLTAGDLATGFVCKRHLYLDYHGLLDGEPRAIWDDDRRYFARQRSLAEEAYYRGKGVKARGPVVLEHPPLRVEVSAVREEGETLEVTVVTSAMSPKQSAVLEAAVAIWILRQQSEEARPVAITLAYLNRAYTPENGDEPLFLTEDISSRSAVAAEEVDRRIEELAAYLRLSIEEVEADPHRCAKPDRCPACSVDLGPTAEDDIFTLFRGREKVLPLFDQGIRRLDDIPEDYALGRRQRIQIHSQRTETIHLEPGPLREFRKRLTAPLGFLDFEAVQEAVPRAPLAKPWQHVPFLFSLHTMSDTHPAHTSYICRGGLDSLPSMASILARALEGIGSIVVYNREMETRCLRYLAARFPELAEVLEGAAGRLVDLYPVFQAFVLYHPGQRGSLSLKRVLPALTDIDYSRMRFQDGRSASLAYYWAHLDSSAPPGPEQREEIDDELERYCGLDTFGLVELLGAMDRLYQRAEKKGPTAGAGPDSEVSLELIAE